MKKINLFFLSIILLAGFFSAVSSAQTAIDLCAREGGTCQTWCSSGYTKSQSGSVYCANENYIKKTCCIKSENIPAINSSAQAGSGCCWLMGNPCTRPIADFKCINGIGQWENKSCEELVAEGKCTKLPAAGSTATSSNATQTAATAQSIEFKNPLNVNTLPDLLTSLLNSLRGVLVTIAVVFMVIGGIMYMVSGGNEKMVTRAKQTWTYAVVGLAISLAAPAFLNEILSILQAGPDVAGTGSSITIKQIALNVLNFLLSIFGVLAIISMIIGGGMYLTAYGDEKRLESGKKIVTYAIIGIVIALSALAVTRQIASLIGVVAK